MRIFGRTVGSLRPPPKWVAVSLGVVLVALLVWFVGPLIAIAKWTPLASWIVRACVIVLLVGGVAAFYAGKAYTARRRNRDMVGALNETPEAPPPDLSAADISAMEERATKTLGLLRDARIGKNREYVYELPWYVIIGPPGAGKTTALQNSGLHFPVAQALGEGPVRGIGGTRTTEWWITDQAVLIDTAGRYTTQDSEQAVDAKAWSGLLALLKRHRPRQPVTGVIVAISMTDLAGADETAALAHGRAVRQRINEIQNTFGVRTPVYVLITKIDLLAGFVEFFDDLAAPEREQVWGETFLFDRAAPQTALPDFETTFNALVERLGARVLSRLQSEQDIQRRGLIFGFPQQFASLREPLAALMKTIGQETRFEPPPLIRGYYFTSGVQLGRPIDRLLGAVSARFGLPVTESAREGVRGRSYFLKELLRGVIFPEAALAGRDAKAERRRKLVALGVVGSGAAAVLLLTALWSVSYVRNAALITKLQQRAEVLRRDTAALPSGEVSDSDLMQVLPVLEQGRALPFGSTAASKERSVGHSYGIGRDHALRTQVDGAYANLLNRQLLPRLILQLEDQLRTLTRDPVSDPKAPDPRPTIYNVLRVYLMLGRAKGAPLEQSGIEAWFADDWADRFPGQDQEPARSSLQRHLKSLISGPLTPPRLDAGLIAGSRARVASLGPGERVYTRLTAEAGLRELPEFTLADAPGVASARLFARRSGKSLATGVPGMFRRQAFYATVLPAIVKAATQSADEGWVMGEPVTAHAPMTSEAGRIKDALMIAYLKDFTTRWDDLIADITVSGERPVGERIQLATRPPSPVKSLIQTLSSETDLSPPSATKGSAAGAFRVGAIFSRSIYRGVSRAGQVNYAMKAGPSGPPGPLDEVIEHFRWLRELNPSSGPAPLDDALHALAAVGESGAAAKSASGMGDPLLQHEKSSTAMAATATLGQVSATLPPPVGAMFNGFVHASTAQLNKDAGAGIRSAFASQLAPECGAIVSQGFPFTPAAEHQVSIDDFSRLFRPTGLIDQFQTQNLNGQIDTSHQTWTLTPAGRALGLQLSAVRQFQLADRIRRVFFKPGDIRPNVRFVIEPLRIEGDASAVTITVDGAPAAFDRANRTPVELRWPGAQPGVSVSFQHQGVAIPAVRNWPGDWGLARMLRDSRTTQASATGLVFQVSEGGASATFRLRLLNTTNPFGLPELAKFQCPSSL